MISWREAVFAGLLLFQFADCSEVVHADLHLLLETLLAEQQVVLDLGAPTNAAFSLLLQPLHETVRVELMTALELQVRLLS